VPLLDTPSGVHRWVDGKLVDVTQELRREFEEELETRSKIAQVETEGFVAEAKRAITKQGVWALLTLIGLVAVGSVTAFAQAVDRLDRRAEAKAKEVVREVVQEQKFQREDIEHVTKKIERVEKLVELQLDRQRVSESSRPPPVPEPPSRDGGR